MDATLNDRGEAGTQAGPSWAKGKRAVHELTTDQILWLISVLLILLALMAAFAEHRRKHRRDLDKVGLMPWNFIQVIAFLGAVIAAVLALKA
jgi:hypothetical protein